MKRFSMPSLLRRRRERRAARTREESRRFASRASMVLVVLGTIAGLIVVANRWLARAEFTGFELRGRSVLDSAEIVAACQIAPGTPLAEIDLDLVERKVRVHPYIASASVYRADNGRLAIDLVERAPVAAVVAGRGIVYLDSQAVVLPARFSSAALDLPFLGGVAARGDSSSAGQIDSVKACEALAVLRTVRGYDAGLYRQISEVRREPTGEYSLLLTDGAIPVAMGRPEAVEARLGKLERAVRLLVHDPQNGRAIAGLDLRWRGQVVVRRRPATQPQT